MLKWLKARTRQEKWMIAVIVMLLIGIALRWGFIKKEAGEAVRDRIDLFRAPEPKTDSLNGPADSGDLPLPGGAVGE